MQMIGKIFGFLATVANWIALVLLLGALCAVRSDSLMPAAVIVGCLLWYGAEALICYIIINHTR